MFCVFFKPLSKISGQNEEGDPKHVHIFEKSTFVSIAFQNILICYLYFMYEF